MTDRRHASTQALVELLGTLLVVALLSIPFALVDNPDCIAIWITVVMVHATWCIAESRAAGAVTRLSPTSPRAPWMPAAIATAAVVVTAVCVLQGALHQGPNEYASIGCVFGVGLAGVGLRLRVLAIRQLGARFLDPISIGTSGHTLEQDGVYARLRHPAETGFILIMVGTVVMTSSSLGALVTLALALPLVWRRMWLEDELLTSSFGPEAVAYQRRVSACGFPRAAQPA